MGNFRLYVDESSSLSFSSIICSPNPSEYSLNGYELIIEPERKINKHDEDDEFYDQLYVKAKRWLHELNLPGRQTMRGPQPVGNLDFIDSVTPIDQVEDQQMRHAGPNENPDDFFNEFVCDLDISAKVSTPKRKFNDSLLKINSLSPVSTNYSDVTNKLLGNDDEEDEIDKQNEDIEVHISSDSVRQTKSSSRNSFYASGVQRVAENDSSPDFLNTHPEKSASERSNIARIRPVSSDNSYRASPNTGASISSKNRDKRYPSNVTTNATVSSDISNRASPNSKACIASTRNNRDKSVILNVTRNTHDSRLTSATNKSSETFSVTPNATKEIIASSHSNEVDRISESVQEQVTSLKSKEIPSKPTNANKTVDVSKSKNATCRERSHNNKRKHDIAIQTSPSLKIRKLSQIWDAIKDSIVVGTPSYYDIHPVE